MEWTWKRSLILLTTILMLYIVGVFYIYIFIDQITFSPTRLAKSHVYDIPFPHENFKISHPNHDSFEVFYFINQSPIKKGVVIFFYGAQKNAAYWSDHVQDFTSRGFDVMMPEYRGFGRSSGSPSEINWYEDALASFSWLKDQTREDSIIIYGYGLGSVASVYVGSLSSTRLILLENPVYGLREWISAKFPSLWLSFELKYDFNLYEYLPHCASPVYIVRSSNSKECTEEEALALKKLLSDESRYINFNIPKDKKLRDSEEFQNFLDQIIKPL
ncbi:MAG: alpha/beta fold hydrolase [Bacteroidota bacterium]|nr:alpha/beta fold hydrolase [Bacteroidota bacterium]